MSGDARRAVRPVMEGGTGDRVPAPGVPMPVAPGIALVRLPLTFSPWHVNAWLMADGEGWTVIDAGTDDAESRGLWTSVFDDHLAGRPVTRLIITHSHLDHVGLAGWIVERFAAPLWISRTDWLLARHTLAEDSAEAFARQQAFHRSAGCSAGFLDYLKSHQSHYTDLVGPLPSSFVRLADGDDVRIGAATWRVMIGAGHAPEQVCLFDPQRRLLVAADHVLETISPYIGVVAQEPDGDPLGHYLAALDRFRALPDDTLVLPSHGLPFFGLHRRIDTLMAGHEARRARILVQCDGQRSAAEIAAGLFRRPLDHRQMKFAVGETLAHLNYLVRRGRVERRLDAAGVHRYRLR